MYRENIQRIESLKVILERLLINYYINNIVVSSTESLDQVIPLANTIVEEALAVPSE